MVLASLLNSRNSHSSLGGNWYFGFAKPAAHQTNAYTATLWLAGTAMHVGPWAPHVHQMLFTHTHVYVFLYLSTSILYDVFGWNTLGLLSASADLRLVPGWCSMMTQMARRASAATRRRTARRKRRRTRKSTRRTRILRRLELRQAGHTTPDCLLICSHGALFTWCLLCRSEMAPA